MKDRELTADLYYSSRNEDEENSYIQNNFLPVYNTPEQKSNNIGKNSNITFQTDYLTPLNEKSKFGAGLKYMMRSTDDDYKFNNYDTITDYFLVDTNLSNRFKYTDQVIAAYSTFSMEWKKFSFQAGLRAEQTYQFGEQKTMNQDFTNEYFSLFPSAHTSYSLPKDNKLQISYSRRINRPSIHSMNPFIDASDPLTLHTGNPYLKPEFINSYEVGHIKDWKKFSLTSSLFYKQTDNVVSRYRIIDTTGVITVMPINVAKATSYGFDFVVSTSPYKFLRLSGDFSWFKTTLDGSNLDTDLTSSIFSYNGKLNASIYLPKNFSMQLNCMFEGPSVMAQAIRKEFYTFDAGIRKDFKNKKISLSLRVSDIFNTMRFRIVTDDPSLKANMEFKRESRVTYFTLTYRINEGVKQKDRRNQDMNGGGGEIDMGE
jgi:outer membrane receptor protein involved in Fe transport